MIRRSSSGRRPFRGFGRATLLVLILLALAATALGDLRDPTAWNVIVPADRIVALTSWNGRLVGADDNGGLLLLAPESGVISSITSLDGMTSNRINDVAADGQGRLWAATERGGLMRIDADGQTRPITSLIDVNVKSLAVDGDFVFYGTQSGAGRVVGGLPEATFTTADGLVADSVQTIAAHAQRVWMGTNRGISEFTNNVFTTRNDGLAGLFIRDLIAGPRGVFCATDRGVFQWSDATNSWSEPAGGTGQSVRSLAFVNGDETIAGIGFPQGDITRLFTLPPAAGAWTVQELSTPNREMVAVGAAPDGSLWLAGRRSDPALLDTDRRAAFWRPSDDRFLPVFGMFGSGVFAVSGDGAGGAWLGTQGPRGGVTHWRADGSAAAYNVGDTGTGVGWCGGNDDSPQRSKFAVHRRGDGSVWVATFRNCVDVMRPVPGDDPNAATYTHIDPDATGLRLRQIQAIREDSRGRLWFLGTGFPDDSITNKGVSILINPDAPLDPANWISVYPENSQMAGGDIEDLAFQGDDIVWLGIESEGVHRWDFDGSSSSSGAQITSQNTAGSWDLINKSRLEGASPSPITDVEFSGVTSLEVASDGTLWVGTSDEGALRMSYDPITLRIRKLDDIKEQSFTQGLLTLNVQAMALDENGDLWVGTDAGLNRVRGTGAELEIESFSNFDAFRTFDLGLRNGPEILSPLPGADIKDLLFDGTSGRLFIGTQTGAASVRVEQLLPAAVPLQDFFVYPNPVRGGSGQVFLGGIEGPVTIEVYNMLGIRILTAREVVRDQFFWDTRDLSQNLVASGTYLVRVTGPEGASSRVLAVER